MCPWKNIFFHNHCFLSALRGCLIPSYPGPPRPLRLRAGPTELKSWRMGVPWVPGPWVPWVPLGPHCCWTTLGIKKLSMFASFDYFWIVRLSNRPPVYIGHKLIKFISLWPWLKAHHGLTLVQRRVVFLFVDSIGLTKFSCCCLLVA